MCPGDDRIIKNLGDLKPSVLIIYYKPDLYRKSTDFSSSLGLVYASLRDDLRRVIPDNLRDFDALKSLYLVWKKFAFCGIADTQIRLTRGS